MRGGCIIWRKHLYAQRKWQFWWVQVFASLERGVATEGTICFYPTSVVWNNILFVSLQLWVIIKTEAMFSSETGWRWSKWSATAPCGNTQAVPQHGSAQQASSIYIVTPTSLHYWTKDIMNPVCCDTGLVHSITHSGRQRTKWIEIQTQSSPQHHHLTWMPLFWVMIESLLSWTTHDSSWTLHSSLHTPTRCLAGSFFIHWCDACLQLCMCSLISNCLSMQNVQLGHGLHASKWTWRVRSCWWDLCDCVSFNPGVLQRWFNKVSPYSFCTGAPRSLWLPTCSIRCSHRKVPESP